MVYNNSIPQATNRPSNSQSDLLGNFQTIKTYVDRNHVAISNPPGNPDEGKHKFLQMPEQGSAPATLANEGALYCVEGPDSSVAELAFRRESDGSEIPFTEANAATTGWTRLPSGILLKWGNQSVTSGSSTVTFTGPSFTSIFQVIPVVSDSSPTPNTFVTIQGVTITNFTVFASARTTTSSASAALRWLAIGLG